MCNRLSSCDSGTSGAHFLKLLLCLATCLATAACGSDTDTQSENTGAPVSMREQQPAAQAPVSKTLRIGTVEHSESEPNRDAKAVIKRVAGAIQELGSFDILVVSWSVHVPAVVAGNVRMPEETMNYELSWNRGKKRVVYVTGIKPGQSRVAAQYVYTGVTDATWAAMTKAFDSRYIDLNSFTSFGAKETRDLSGRKLSP